MKPVIFFLQTITAIGMIGGIIWSIVNLTLYIKHENEPFDPSGVILLGICILISAVLIFYQFKSFRNGKN